MSAGADTMLDHQISQSRPVNEDHPLREILGILDSTLGKTRGRHKDTFTRPKAKEVAKRL